MKQRYLFFLIICFSVLFNHMFLFSQSADEAPVYSAENATDGDFKAFVKKIYELLLHGHSTDEVIAIINDGNKYAEKKESEKKETVQVYVRDSWGGALIISFTILVIFVVIALFVLSFLPKKGKQKVPPLSVAPRQQEVGGSSLPKHEEFLDSGGLCDFQSSKEARVRVMQQLNQELRSDTVGRDVQGEKNQREERSALTASEVGRKKTEVNPLGPIGKRVYVYDAKLEEEIVQQVADAVNMGFKLEPIQSEPDIERKDKIICGEKTEPLKELGYFEEIAPQIAYAKSIGFEPVEVKKIA